MHDAGIDMERLRRGRGALLLWWVLWRVLRIKRLGAGLMNAEGGILGVTEGRFKAPGRTVMDCVRSHEAGFTIGNLHSWLHRTRRVFADIWRSLAIETIVSWYLTRFLHF